MARIAAVEAVAETSFTKAELENKLIPVKKLNRDVIKVLSGKAMAATEARFLVDTYYTFQRYRIRSNNQVRGLAENEEPHEVVQWFGMQFDTLETEMKKALKVFAESDPTGRWAMCAPPGTRVKVESGRWSSKPGGPAACGAASS